MFQALANDCSTAAWPRSPQFPGVQAAEPLDLLHPRPGYPGAAPAAGLPERAPGGTMGLSPVLHPSAAGRKVPAPPLCAGCQPLDGEAHVTQGQPSSLPFEWITFLYLRTKMCIKYLGELKEEAGDQKAIPWYPEVQDGAVGCCFFFNSHLLNPFSELQKILTAPGCLHQQVCPVYPQVHHMQCPGSCVLLAEALGSTPVSFLTPVIPWLAHGELAQSGCRELIGQKTARGCDKIAINLVLFHP